MRLSGLLCAAISLRKARKRLQRPRRRACQLYGYSRPLWEPHIVMTPPTAFSTIHPQPDDPSRSATRPHRQRLFARGLKYLRLRPAGPIVAALWDWLLDHRLGFFGSIRNDTGFRRSRPFTMAERSLGTTRPESANIGDVSTSELSLLTREHRWLAHIYRETYGGTALPRKLGPC
jgi:hypothetical protein